MTARMSFLSLEAAIRQIMTEQPELSSAGYCIGLGHKRNREEMLLPNFREMVTDVLLDLASRRIPANYSSYGQKHLSESRLGRYITNGAFIVGAILAGYVPMRAWHNLSGPNCEFRNPRKAKPHPALCGGDYSRGWDQPGSDQ